MAEDENEKKKPARPERFYEDDPDTFVLVSKPNEEEEEENVESGD